MLFKKCIAKMISNKKCKEQLLIGFRSLKKSIPRLDPKNRSIIFYQFVGLFHFGKI